MRMRMLLVLSAVVALAVVASASGAPGGYSENAKKCQKGGWANLVRADQTPFANPGECVSYAAKGGTLGTKPQAQIACESLGGTYSTDPSTDQNAIPGTPVVFLFGCQGYVSENTPPTLIAACFALAGPGVNPGYRNSVGFSCYNQV